MSFLDRNIIPFIIGGLIYSYLVYPLPFRYLSELPSKGKEPKYLHTLPDKKGYRDIICYQDKFMAVGTGGRIDYINTSGERTTAANITKNDLNCIISANQILLTGGLNGTILFSSDGQVFNEVKSGTNNTINDIAFKRGLFIAGADKGTILLSANGQSWSMIHLSVKGNIISLAANDSFFTGVTDTGEIIRTDDGISWEITDYNKEYAGFNRPCKFRKVYVTAKRIVLIGSHDDGSPAVLFSSLGNVWTERTLIYTDNHGMVRFLTNTPNDITYDSARDQFILACDNGELFSLPSCTKCNVSVKISSNDLSAALVNGNLLLCAGEEFYATVINL
jgi:hypothetical protein